MHVTDSAGRKSMVVIETNSCPSGQKSTPLFDDHQEEGGYRTLLVRSLLPRIQAIPEDHIPGGALAVLYDKNPMEASGYAAALADITGETVHLVPFMDGDADPKARFRADVLEVRLPTLPPRGDYCSSESASASSGSEDEAGERRRGGAGPPPEERWVPIRAAVRYVTQRPWHRIPLDSRTVFMNPIVACLAGGRNKIVAAKAYDNYNVELLASGLAINTPHTIRDVPWDQLEGWVAKLGGHACIKVPYSNAGQGVYTITSGEEFRAFQEAERNSQYSCFIVQSLISNHEWSSCLEGSRYYHVGTIPDKRGNIFVADLRIMVSASSDGFQVVGIYGRKAPKPLSETITPGTDSWAMLGTNLSVKLDAGKFTSEAERLLLMDRRDFNVLGIGLDELIDGYVQTCLATVAIDRMACFLMPGGKFSLPLLRSLNDDAGLLCEIPDPDAQPPRC